ncbi:unnamed protein product [Cylindrotheca closterium]|uniref:Uncharacterized protein n=1 Tax=Cylindrotheca closterium TaxID=2856 RepID=A0AAD2CG78_9STRA|nr:unnamed protein product [Cylindrotheca closterium]
MGDDRPGGLLDKANITVNKLESKRLAIAYLFVHFHGAPPRDTWKGKTGIQTKIRSALSLSQSTCIMKDLEDIMRCYEQGIEYNPSLRSGRGRKREAAVTPDGPEA